MTVSTMSPPTASSTPRRTRVHTVGVVLALIGAALTAAMVFAPWLTPGSLTAGEAMTGWDLHQAAADTSQWYIRNFFNSSFSPLFLALPMFVTAAVMALCALAIWFTSRPQRVPMRLVAGLVSLAAVGVAVLNPMSLLATGPGSEILGFGWGMIGTVVGVVLGAIGLVVSTSPNVK